jgi:hypothetical protein
MKWLWVLGWESELQKNDIPWISSMMVFVADFFYAFLVML